MTIKTNTFDSEEVPEDPNQATQNLITLISDQFQIYCEVYKAKPEDISAIDSTKFLYWVRERLEYATDTLKDDICSKLELGWDTLDMLVEFAKSPVGANQLAGIWPQIVMASRGKPEHEIASIHNIALIKWKDGHVAPLSAYIPSELADSAKGYFDDGNICTMIQVNAQNLVSIVQSINMDRIHDEKAVAADDTAYDVLMGLMVRIVAHNAVVIDPETSKHMRISEDMLTPCLAVLRVLQGMFRPPVPMIAVQAAEQAQARQRDLQAAKQPEPPTSSGWE